MTDSPTKSVRQPSSRPATRVLARQACDACRVRKSRCDTDINDFSPDSSHGQDALDPAQFPADRRLQCRRCVKFGLTCTFLLPSNVRGPRPKDKSISTTGPASSPTVVSPHQSLTADQRSSYGPDVSPNTTVVFEEPVLENEQRVFLDHSNGYGSATNSRRWSIPPQPTLSQLSPESSQGQVFPTDGLCSRRLIHRILGDYLNFIYPLVPVVHRPSFCEDLKRSRDMHDKDFLGLILSICALTVGTMPSRFRAYQSLPTPIKFQTRTEMIRHCYEMISNLRRPEYFERINLQKWALSYCLGIAFFQIGEHNQSRMIEVESMQLARLLGLHQISEYNGLNCIETQLRKKAFWLMFYGYVHAQLANLRNERLTFLDPTIFSTLNLESLMPVEVDDEMISEDEIITQPPIGHSLAFGFIIHSRVFWAALTSFRVRDTLAAKRTPCLCVRTTHPTLQLAHFKDRLHELKYMLDGLPPQLRQWTAGDDDTLYSTTPEQRKILEVQFASMRANIHVTHLWLQSIILDQVDALTNNESSLGSSPITSPPDLKASWAEREDICRQLLHVLHAIPERHVEPNGHYLTYKVRDVAVTLLACPFEPHEEASRRASEYLREFAKKLSRLDGSEIMNTMSLQSWVDTDRRGFIHGDDGPEPHSQWC